MRCMYVGIRMYVKICTVCRDMYNTVHTKPALSRTKDEVEAQLSGGS